MNEKLRNAIRILLPVILAGFVSLLIKDNMDYDSLIKPAFAPPAIVFPIVWTILYLLIGFSYYLFRKEDVFSSDIRKLYYFQLGVNLIWPILFFKFRLFFFSILWIVLLLSLVILYFKSLLENKYKISAYLLIPFLIWLIIATYLNIAVYLLN